MCSGGLLVLLIILLFFGILCAFIPSHVSYKITVLLHCMLNSFIHSRYLYSTPSRNLLKGALSDPATAKEKWVIRSELFGTHLDSNTPTCN